MGEETVIIRIRVERSRCKIRHAVDFAREGGRLPRAMLGMPACVVPGPAGCGLLFGLLLQVVWMPRLLWACYRIPQQCGCVLGLLAVRGPTIGIADLSSRGQSL